MRQGEAAFVDSGAWIALAMSRDPLHREDSIYEPGTVVILPCELGDLKKSWEYFRRSDLHKLSAVDATSFAIMRRARIRLAFAFDHHFAVAGFRMAG